MNGSPNYGESLGRMHARIIRFLILWACQRNKPGIKPERGRLGVTSKISFYRSTISLLIPLEFSSAWFFSAPSLVMNAPL